MLPALIEPILAGLRQYNLTILPIRLQRHIELSDFQSSKAMISMLKDFKNGH